MRMKRITITAWGEIATTTRTKTKESGMLTCTLPCCKKGSSIEESRSGLSPAHSLRSLLAFSVPDQRGITIAGHAWIEYLGAV